MNKSLFYVGVLALASLCKADAPTVSWINPTQNTDGSTIPDAPADGSLISTRVEYGSCGAGGTFGVKAGEVIVLEPTVTLLMSQLTTPGTYCFQASVSSSLGESVPSNVVSKTVVAPPPVLVTYTKNVFQINKGKVVLVGTIALKTPCGVDAKVKSPSSGAELYVVPRTAVHFTHKDNGTQTFGVCR